MNWTASRPCEWSRGVWAGSGGAEATYLTRLDAVDQDRVGVPLAPPGAHDALEEEAEGAKTKTPGQWEKGQILSSPHPSNPVPMSKVKVVWSCLWSC